MTSYCVFNVGEKRVGLPLAHVREIIEPHHIVPTPIPLTPPFVHGLFNLRGQVLTWLDLAPFVGAPEAGSQQPEVRPPTTDLRPPTSDLRAVIVERGSLRFAALGRRIDTVEADPATFQPLAGAALHPALDAEAQTEYGSFHVIYLDRLEACLGQSLKLTETRSPRGVMPLPGAGQTPEPAPPGEANTEPATPPATPN